MPVDSSSCYYQWQMTTSNFQIHFKIKELFPFFLNHAKLYFKIRAKATYENTMCKGKNIYDYLEKHTFNQWRTCNYPVTIFLQNHNLIAQYKYWTLHIQPSRGNIHKQFDYIVLENTCRENNQLNNWYISQSRKETVFERDKFSWISWKNYPKSPNIFCK